MRRCDGVVDQRCADVVLGGLDDTCDRNNAAAGTVAGSAVECGGAEVDAVFATARGGAGVGGELIAVRLLDQVIEHRVQRRHRAAVRQHGDAANADRDSRTAVDVGRRGWADLIDHDGAGKCVAVGCEAARRRAGGNHARVVGQHQQGVVVGDRTLADMCVRRLSARGIGDRRIDHCEADAGLAARHVECAAADRDVCRLVCIYFDRAVDAGRGASDRGILDIGIGAVRDDAYGSRQRRGVAFRSGHAQGDDGLCAAVHRLHRHIALVLHCGAVDVG